jgi:hypothetical protein
VRKCNPIGSILREVVTIPVPAPGLSFSLTFVIQVSSGVLIRSPPRGCQGAVDVAVILRPCARHPLEIRFGGKYKQLNQYLARVGADFQRFHSPFRAGASPRPEGDGAEARFSRSNPPRQRSPAVILLHRRHLVWFLQILDKRNW